MFAEIEFLACGCYVHMCVCSSGAQAEADLLSGWKDPAAWKEPALSPQVPMPKLGDPGILTWPPQGPVQMEKTSVGSVIGGWEECGGNVHNRMFFCSLYCMWKLCLPNWPVGPASRGQQSTNPWEASRPERCSESTGTFVESRRASRIEQRFEPP